LDASLCLVKECQFLTHAPQHEARLRSVVRVMQPIVWGFLLMSRYPNTRVALAMSAAAAVDAHPTD
jgi:hypothetical protein